MRCTLSEAISVGFDRQPLYMVLEAYGTRRDHEALPMYEFTTGLASFGPPKAEDLVLFASLLGNQAEIDRFPGVLTGSVSMRQYQKPGNLLRVISLRGLAKGILGRMRPQPPREPPHEPLTRL